MTMRHFMNVLEAATPAIKAWYNSTTGKAIVMDFYDKHIEVVRQNKTRMKIPRDCPEPSFAAVENGWVRLSSATEVTRTPVGYMTARSSKDARDALRWMEKNGYLPPAMEVELIQNGRWSYVSLADDALFSFIRRGIIPKHQMSGDAHSLTESFVLSSNILDDVIKYLVAHVGDSDSSYCKMLYRAEQGSYDDNDFDSPLDDGTVADASDFEQWLHDFYEDRVHEKYSEISWAARDGGLDIWRMITAPRDWKPIPDRHIGLCWSWEQDAAEAHWGDFSENNVQWCIHARAASTDVDWYTTLCMNASTSYEEEKEIRLLPTADPEIIEYNIVE